jgi:outer membrane protein assembly factor BamB
MLLSLARWARRRWYIVGVLVLVAAGGLTVFLTYGQRPGDVLNQNVPFSTPSPVTPPPTTTTTTTTPGKKAQPQAPAFVNWPMYGFDLGRTHYMPGTDSKLVNPPFTSVWSIGGRTLMEFQPVLWKGTMFFVKNDGTAYAVRTRTGHVMWTRKVGNLAASSPAWMNGHIFITTLSGRITALNARDGRLLWAKNLPSRTESSPLPLNGNIYFGSENGTVYALRASDGHVQWTYHASGDVTAGPAYSNGLLYFGDYGGNVQAVQASNGKLVWRTHEAGLGFGRSGGFYGTPAVAFGCVYVGNLDRKVYSFSARTGQLAWSHSTGNYVYAAPAVADVPGVDPSVYVGSYDGTFYALDARTGAVRWSYRASGPISGAASVIGRVVYFATLVTHRTYGLDVRTGKLVFSFAHGAYNPAISDGLKLYITGFSSQYGLEPRSGG